MSKFNKDLDKYLRQRRENKFSFRFGNRQKIVHEPVPEVHEHEVTVEDREPSFWSKLFKKQEEPVSEDLTPEERAKLEAMEHDLESIDEMEAQDPEHKEMYEEAKEGLIERFFQSIRLFRHRHQVEEEAELVMEAEDDLEQEKAMIDQDVKDVLKVTHKWLGKLSKRQREAFMESDDYARYKEVLEKHGIAKAKK